MNLQAQEKTEREKSKTIFNQRFLTGMKSQMNAS